MLTIGSASEQKYLNLGIAPPCFSFYLDSMFCLRTAPMPFKGGEGPVWVDIVQEHCFCCFFGFMLLRSLSPGGSLDAAAGKLLRREMPDFSSSENRYFPIQPGPEATHP